MSVKCKKKKETENNLFVEASSFVGEINTYTHSLDNNFTVYIWDLIPACIFQWNVNVKVQFNSMIRLS